MYDIFTHITIMISKSQPLDITHPHLVKEWDYKKNYPLTPNKFTHGARMKVWWICSKTNCVEKCEHSWSTEISHRSKGSKCPFCCKLKCCMHNTIAYTHKKIALEFHPTKNGKLRSNQFSAGSSVVIWWLCSKKCSNNSCLHEWRTTVSNRIAGSTCPFCAGQKLSCEHESLASKYPKLAKEWHYEKNGKLKPTNILCKTDKNIWWICKNENRQGCEICAHVWQEPAWCRLRIYGKISDCPFCVSRKKVAACEHTSIVYTHSNIMNIWNYEKNKNVDPKKYSRGSGKIVWWKCKDKSHEWKTSISRITRGSGCPNCKHKTEKKLLKYLITLYPSTVTQFKAQWCKNITYLSFDFYIPELKLLIELDGCQHFINFKYFKMSGDQTRERDILKLTLSHNNDFRIIHLSQEDVLEYGDDWLDKKLKPMLTRTEKVIFIESTKRVNTYQKHIDMLENDNMLDKIKKMTRKTCDRFPFHVLLYRLNKTTPIIVQ